MQTSKLIFFATALLHLGGLVANVEALAFWTKPLLMPALAYWFWENAKGTSNIKAPILSALAFSTLGDVALLFAEGAELFFIAGLGSFLIAHIFYIIVFTRMVPLRAGFLKKRPWIVLPVLLYLLGFIGFLWSDLCAQKMEIPVAVYALIISTMLCSVLNLKNFITKNAFGCILLGALLFVFSDSLIAIHKFKMPTADFGFGIMLTYIVGQFLIVWGVTHRMSALIR